MSFSYDYKGTSKRESKKGYKLSQIDAVSKYANDRETYLFSNGGKGGGFCNKYRSREIPPKLDFLISLILIYFF